jgi:hypothetical protein
VATSVSLIAKVVWTFAKCVHKGGQHHDVESGPSCPDSIAEDDRDEKEGRLHGNDADTEPPEDAASSR